MKPIFTFSLGVVMAISSTVAAWYVMKQELPKFMESYNQGYHQGFKRGYFKGERETQEHLTARLAYLEKIGAIPSKEQIAKKIIESKTPEDLAKDQSVCDEWGWNESQCYSYKSSQPTYNVH